MNGVALEEFDHVVWRESRMEIDPLLKSLHSDPRYVVLLGDASAASRMSGAADFASLRQAESVEVAITMIHNRSATICLATFRTNPASCIPNAIRLIAGSNSSSSLRSNA